MTLIGAGLAGALLAIVLARRGYGVEVFERRSDPRLDAVDQGRSINLALAARGVRGLQVAGLADAVVPLLMPMRGRLVHDHDGTDLLLPYGQHADEVIFSVSRAALGRLLINAAAATPGVSLRFGETCTGVDVARSELQFEDPATGHRRVVPFETTIATDGAGSAIRHSLAREGTVHVREEPLAHDYLELSMPASSATRRLDREALHIWPRRGFMLIALPNTDGSFTATLFLPRTGSPSFADLTTDRAVRAFFVREFPTALPLLESLEAEFREHPQGRLGTVYTDPWHVGGRLLLLGDAAHAIVPFHGQGMNCAFEDVAMLDTLLTRGDDPASVFAEFERVRRPSTDAIAAMALENYLEMRDAVLDPAFRRQSALAAALELAFPDRFIPRYSMVMFHPELTYAEALERGNAQAEILAILDGQQADGAFDPDTARNLIESRLPKLNRRRDARA